MKIAIAQMNSTPGAFDATASAMVAYARRAEELGADLLVFGAPALMGPDPMGLGTNEAYLLEATRALGTVAEQIGVPALVPYTSNITGVPTYDVAYVRNGAVVPISLTSMLDAIGPGGVDSVARGIRERIDADARQADAPSQAARLIEPAVIEVGGVDVGVALSLGDLDAFCTGELEADVVCLMPVDGYDTDDEMTCLAPSVSDGCFVPEAADADAWLVVAGASGAYDAAAASSWPRGESSRPRPRRLARSCSSATWTCGPRVRCPSASSRRRMTARRCCGAPSPPPFATR